MSTRNATRRTCDVNYGDRERVRGREQRSLAWISVEDSQAFMVYVSADIDAPAALIPQIRAVASIEWGHGGASIAEDYPVARRLSVPVVGSMVRVNVRLVDVTGAAVPDAASAECAAVIAPGFDATTRNTRWIVTHGSGGVLSERPERVVAVYGHNSTPFNRWFMLFDTRVPAAAGAAPVLARPALLTPPFDVGDCDSRPFFAGVAWGVSQDPIAYVPDGAADVHIEVGFLL